jgi:succinylglutamate desuccinylase
MIQPRVTHKISHNITEKVCLRKLVSRSSRGMVSTIFLSVNETEPSFANTFTQKIRKHQFRAYMLHSFPSKAHNWMHNSSYSMIPC